MMINISTIDWQGLTAKETRDLLFKRYNETFCKSGLVVTNNQKKIKIRFERTGANKTAYGSRIYPKKAALVQELSSILKEMDFTNFASKKVSDQSNVVGYLNFKFKVCIDGKKESLKVVIRLKNDGTFHYSIDVNLIKKPT